MRNTQDFGATDSYEIKVQNSVSWGETALSYAIMCVDSMNYGYPIIWNFLAFTPIIKICSSTYDVSMTQAFANLLYTITQNMALSSND